MPFSYFNPFGKLLTSIGSLSRKPTPPVLSTAVTGIGVIGSFLVTVASAAVMVGPVLSPAVTVKVKVTGFAWFPASSVALKVIVCVLPTSSGRALRVIFLICLVAVLPFASTNACAVISLLLYFGWTIKSLTSRLAFLSSVAVTVNVTHSPSVTVWFSGVMVKVGACLSGASVGITASLLSEVTVPLALVTTVSAVIGFPGKAPVTVTVAVSPLVVPVPITLSPS